LTPQMSEPRSFTALSVWADAVSRQKPSETVAAKRKSARFMKQPFLRLSVSTLDRSLGDLRGFFNVALPTCAGVPAGIVPACADLALVYLPSQNDRLLRSRG